MDIQQLQCFVAVAEELHFGRAAGRLHLSPSPVSRAIKDLERELGCRLFDREHHRVELTSAGAQLLDPVRDVLRRLADLPRLAASAGPPPVRIAATYSAPPEVLDGFVAQMEEMFPDRIVEVSMSRSGDLEGVVAGRVDASLVLLPPEQPALDYVELNRRFFVIVTRSDDPLADRGRVTAMDLAGRTLLVPPPTDQMAAMTLLYGALRDHGIEFTPDPAAADGPSLAAHIRRNGSVSLTFDPSEGGAPRVFDDPTFAVLPFEAPELFVVLGVTWRRDRAVADEVVRTIAASSRAREDETRPRSQL